MSTFWIETFFISWGTKVSANLISSAIQSNPFLQCTYKNVLCSYRYRNAIIICVYYFNNLFDFLIMRNNHGQLKLTIQISIIYSFIHSLIDCRCVLYTGYIRKVDYFFISATIVCMNTILMLNCEPYNFY